MTDPPSRIQSGEDAQVPIDWHDYGVVAVLIPVLHLAMAKAVSELSETAGAYPMFSRLWWITTGLLTGVPFVLSQLSSAQAIRSLNAALHKDWSVAERMGRSRMYLLAGLPIVACIWPALTAGALLSGVISKLVYLVLAWKFLDIPPSSAIYTTCVLFKGGHFRKPRAGNVLSGKA